MVPKAKCPACFCVCVVGQKAEQVFDLREVGTALLGHLQFAFTALACGRGPVEARRVVEIGPGIKPS